MFVFVIASGIVPALTHWGDTSSTQREVFVDPHLEQTGFHWTTDHAALGPWKYPRLPLELSDVPVVPPKAAPMLGEHNDYVFGTLLGLPQDEIARLTEEGVLV